MKTAAIISEYNPFHNGHKYQIEQAKLSHDAVVCIMSGSFVQRGDIAIFDKWTRANAALSFGCDLLIELPVCFSLNTAERFAYGGVSLADSLGVVDTLLFGSECRDINKLTSAANILLNEPLKISDEIKKYMAEGLSHPSAKTKAYSKIIDEDLIKEPNNILGIEYIKALNAINSTITPQTIKRNSVSHHDLNSVNEFASATLIRQLLNENKDISKFVPVKYPKPVKTDKLNELIRYKLLEMSTYELSLINDVSEGLENRIKEAIKECMTFDEICEFVKSKRYTLAKIRRILLSSLLGIDKDIAKNPPSYIRVLGATKNGLELLSQIKEKSTLPIITKTADFKGFNKSFDLDIYATDVYNIIHNKPIGEDFYTSPTIKKL